MGILNRKIIEKKETNKATKVAKEVSDTLKKKEKVEKVVTQKAVLVPNKRVLLGAHVSEKSAGVEATGRYTFKVSLHSTKLEIKQEIKAHYGVLPESVRVMHVEGKRKSFGKSKGKRSDWKKAIVTLPKGKSIDIHSGI